MSIGHATTLPIARYLCQSCNQMLPTLDLPAKDQFMFDLLSIYEMKEDIANNAAAIAEFHPDTTTTTTISSTTTTATTKTTTKITPTTTTTTTTTTTINGISSKKTNTSVTFFDHQ